MSDTSTVLASQEELLTSSVLRSSLGSLTSPRKSRSEFSKAYKEASNFFLTRRFPDALSSIEPLVTAPQNNGQDRVDLDTNTQAPVARADTKWRVKLWSFYLTLLNAVAELGEEEGKAAFGRQRWRSLVAKTEDGTIWDEVVNVGYGGIESRMDAEVVINIANLLLAQSSSQKTNQQHLETYISGNAHADLSVDSRFGSQINPNNHDKPHKKHSQRTDTPRDLETRIQIIEIYALHVLPRNGEWDYAKDFVHMSDILDEERKDAFLQTLQDLQAEDIGSYDEYEDSMLQHVEAIPPSDVTRTDSNVTIKPDSPSIHRRMNSENDYGIENTQPEVKASTLKSIPPKPAVEPAPKLVREPSRDLQPQPLRAPPSKSSKSVSQPNVLKRSMAIFATLQRLIASMTLQVSQNPVVLLRFVLFLTGLVVAFSRRDIRDRVGRVTGAGWDKIQKTIGMGVKVSYI